MPYEQVSNVLLGSDAARPNFLVNGGFEIWQRGLVSQSVNGGFICDRWGLSLNGTSTGTASPESANTDNNSVYACKIVYVQGSGSSSVYQQLGADWIAFRGKWASLSVRAKTSVPNALRLTLHDGVNGASGAYHSGSGNWETLTTSLFVNGANPALNLYLEMVASGTHYYDNAMLVIGQQPADYVPLHRADDLARCRRYYTILGELPGELDFEGYNAAGAGSTLYLIYPARTPLQPTVTKNGPWSTTINCAQPTIAAAGVSGATMRTAVTAAGGFALINNGTGSNITVECNP